MYYYQVKDGWRWWCIWCGECSSSPVPYVYAQLDAKTHECEEKK